MKNRQFVNTTMPEAPQRRSRRRRIDLAADGQVLDDRDAVDAVARCDSHLGPVAIQSQDRPIRYKGHMLPPVQRQRLGRTFADTNLTAIALSNAYH